MRIEKYIYKPKTIDPLWKHYFSESVEGQEYTVLIDCRENLVMSDTEFELRTNQPILEQAYGDVLIVGLGLNVINDKVLKLDQVSSVDTIEISKWVIDNVETLTNIIQGNYKTHPFTKTYDVVYFDAFDTFVQKPLLDILKPKRKLINWEPI